MEVEFGDDDLARLEEDADFDAGFPGEVVRKFRMRMQLIRAAPDERDFYASKGLHFEKLKGARANEHSMKLDNQYRLIMKFRGKGAEKVVIICSVEDYH